MLFPYALLVAPRRPEIQLPTQPRSGAFEISQPFSATCISRDGRPPAKLEWFLDDEPLTEGLSPPRVLDAITDQNVTVYTVVQSLNRYLKANDDRRTIYCRTAHPAEKGIVQEAKYQLQVRCKLLSLRSLTTFHFSNRSCLIALLCLLYHFPVQPQKEPESVVYGLILDQTALVNVTIHSNPRPTIQWIIDGQSVSQGSQSGRYEAYQPVDLGNGTYNITLGIGSLSQFDTEKTYILRASNEFGTQDYQVRISSSPLSAESGLDLGSIISIVLGILVIIAIVIVILFARATGRLCFAGEFYF